MIFSRVSRPRQSAVMHPHEMETYLFGLIKHKCPYHVTLQAANRYKHIAMKGG